MAEGVPNNTKGEIFRAGRAQAVLLPVCLVRRSNVSVTTIHQTSHWSLRASGL